MKATIELDDELARRARRLAASEGKTLSELVEEALRARVMGTARVRACFSLDLPVVRGRSEPSVDIGHRVALYDLLDSK